MTIDQCPSTHQPGPKQKPGKAELIAQKRSLAGTVGGAAPGMSAWRSGEELADTAEFRDFVEREFPAGASELLSSSRRGFLQVMGASLALAGLATVPGCRRPDHKILAYAKDVPEEVIPGKPLYYATSMPMPGGGAEGLLIETHEGRPTKIEGNPLHPINNGKSSAWAQGSILSLYDPDRLKFPVYNPTGKEASWDDVAAWAGEHFAKFSSTGGEGLAFIVEKKTSLSRSAQRERLLKKFPKAAWVSWDPVQARGPIDGSAISFGTPMRELLSLSKAKVILSLDRDFLSNEPGQLVNAREFAATRLPKRTGANQYEMSRLYVVESGMTLTGGQADHRLRLAPSRIVAFAVELAKFVISKTGTAGTEALASAVAKVSVPESEKLDLAFLEEAAKDLLDSANRGAAVVLAGRSMPAEVHALCHALNACLGSLGSVVRYQPMDAEAASDCGKDLRALAQRMSEGKIDTLVVIDANPVYDAPGDVNFAEAYKKVPTTVCMSVGQSETAAASTWSLNGCHYLECWGDTIANDGCLAPQQPMIAPLFGPQLTEAERSLPESERPLHALSELELLALIAGDARPDGYRLVREAWRAYSKSFAATETDEAFDARWRRSLQDGFMMGQPTIADVREPRYSAIAQAVSGMSVPQGPAEGRFDVVFTIGHVHDGRYANCAWLQELPEFGTMVCWDNPALLSPKTAVKLGVWPEDPKYNKYTAEKYPAADLIEITLDGRTVKVAAWILPGMADDTIILKHGYGRTACGRVGDGVGFNLYPLASSATGGRFGSGASVRKTDGEYWIASTQNHWSMESRTSIVRTLDLPAFSQHADKEPEPVAHPLYGGEPMALNLAEKLGELSHTPPNISIYEHPYNKSLSDPSPKANPAFLKGPQWGMTIDLTTCTGCGVCTIACQAENNIPVVGKKETAKGREMTWIRVDRYFLGYNEGQSIDRMNDVTDILHQPVACVHCEYAPCETVCPVNATVHTKDGMNAMAYNRCIGTRYCANNCPYKVRRFNYFDYGVTKFNGDYLGKDAVESVVGVLPGNNTGVSGSTVHGTANPNLIPPRLREKLDQIERLQKNPDVTIRSRGVMEKCSYCVQRINAARIETNLQKDLDPTLRNKIPDGFFQTACQQACPSNSIIFGDILDDSTEYTTVGGGRRTGSRVHHSRKDPRAYLLLGYLNTRPRTSHMLRVRNPNRALLARTGAAGEARIKSWDHPFGHHHDDGHAPEGGAKKDPGHAFVDPRKRTEDQGYALTLKVLGGVHA